jgi:hydroxymethylbilane synthase
MSDSKVMIRIGTRGSDLALTQAYGIKKDLEQLGAAAEITIIKTSGDLDQTRPFAEVGAPGLFVRELERALIESRVDMAVHCYKDLPSDSSEELQVVASPLREDPRDRLLIRAQYHERNAEGLPLKQGARVGTASARRLALLKDLRPDLECVHLRGNVPTRINKLQSGDYDAILLASAGINRLELAATRGECDPVQRTGLVEVNLDPTRFVPAPSQGALALQVRRGDEDSAKWVRQLDDEKSHRAVLIERNLLALVEAGCQVPFGAIAIENGTENMELLAALEVNGQMRRVSITGAEPALLAQAVYEQLLPERK